MKNNFSQLTANMWEHSQKTINKLITYANDVKLKEINNIKTEIQNAMISFLERKNEIQQEYPNNGEPWNTYAFLNRKEYRKNIRNIIKKVLDSTVDKELSKKTLETKKALIEELDRDD